MNSKPLTVALRFTREELLRLRTIAPVWLADRVRNAVTEIERRHDARARKRAQNREYMRNYMRAYRAKTRQSEAVEPTPPAPKKREN